MVYHFYSCRFFFVSSYLVWDLDLRLCSSSCSNILYDNWRTNNTGEHHHDLEERYWISNTIKQIHVSGYVCAHKEYIKEMSLTKGSSIYQLTPGARRGGSEPKCHHGVSRGGSGPSVS